MWLILNPLAVVAVDSGSGRYGSWFASAAMEHSFYGREREGTHHRLTKRSVHNNYETLERADHLMSEALALPLVTGTYYRKGVSFSIPQGTTAVLMAKVGSR